jgi:hypothetical protein
MLEYAKASRYFSIAKLSLCAAHPTNGNLPKCARFGGGSCRQERINKRDLKSKEFGKRGGFIWDFGPHVSPGLHGRKTWARVENHLK